MRPLEGVEPVLVDSATGSIMTDRSAEGLLCFRKPWPWMARTIWRDHRRFLSTYFETYKGKLALLITLHMEKAESDIHAWDRSLLYG